MKLPSVFSAIALLGASFATAATVPLYITSSPVQSPPGPAPQIDATTWVNQTTFEVNDFSGNPLTYHSINTLNFRNDPGGNMFGHPGYFFENVPSNTRMSTWQNRGSIGSFPNPTNLFFLLNGPNWLLVNSDSVTNSGILQVTAQGLMRLEGNTINLSRGRMRSGLPLQSFSTGTGGAYLFDTNYFNDLGLTDIYWGAGSNNVMSGAGTLMPINGVIPSFSEAGLISAQHTVIQSFGTFLSTNNFNFIGLGKGAVSSVYVSTNLNASEIVIQAVFVATNFFDTNLAPEISFVFPNGPQSPAIAQVGFRSVDRDVALDVDITNAVYVMDGMALRTNVALIRNASIAVNGRRPDTYEVSTAPYGNGFFAGLPGNSGTTNWFSRTTYASNAVATVYAAYSAQLTAQTLTGSDPTNYPGRIEVWGQDVNLRDSRIRSESTFILSAANLVSNSLARVSAPYLCFDIGTTQPQLVVSNLAPATVNRLSGTVSAWSAMWVNSDSAIPGMTLRFHVLMVDHSLQGTQPVVVSKFFGRAPRMVFHDSLSVNQRLRVDANSLHIKPGGGLTFPPNSSWGSTNMVNIVNYTNEGIVSVPGIAVLGSDRGFPYTYVINRGTQTAQSQSIWANTFENYGSLVAQGSSFTLNATDVALRGLPIARELRVTTNVVFFPVFTETYVTNVVFTGAATIAANGDVNITASTMSLSNALLHAGTSVEGSVVINASQRLTDAGPGKTNYLIASGGMRVPVRPSQFSDLMGTYAVIRETNGSEVVITWDGKNLGPTINGYSNNLALGKLTLDGAPDTFFRFVGVPGKDNAIYVDYLELLNNATNFANPSVFSFDANFKIYFAHANIAAGRLNGAQNNHIRWVPWFTGPLSTTNITYPSGITYPVNISLATYPDFDSDGDGIPNHKDATPIYTADNLNLAIDRGQTNRMLLSWQALASSTSYLEYKPSVTASTWQLLRSTTAPSNMRITMTDNALTGRTQRIYRVRVDLPPR